MSLWAGVSLWWSQEWGDGLCVHSQTLPTVPRQDNRFNTNAEKEMAGPYWWTHREEAHLQGEGWVSMWRQHLCLLGQLNCEPMRMRKKQAVDSELRFQGKGQAGALDVREGAAAEEDVRVGCGASLPSWSSERLPDLCMGGWVSHWTQNLVVLLLTQSSLFLVQMPVSSWLQAPGCLQV